MYLQDMYEALKTDPLRKTNYLLYSDILMDEGESAHEADLWRILGTEELYNIGKIILENPENIFDIKFTSNPENPFYIPDFLLRYVKRAEKDGNRYRWNTIEDLKEDLKHSIQCASSMGWL